jgi:hypothetical protein
MSGYLVTGASVYWCVNVEPIERLLDAAGQACVRQVVYSTGVKAAGDPGEEGFPHEA